MSWSIEEHIGECRPFPAQVVVYKGETEECLAYVSGEVADRLKAENDKLRELASGLHQCLVNEGCEGCPMQDDDGWCVRDIRLHELGIEVSE